jgi:hypothetical protein
MAMLKRAEDAAGRRASFKRKYQGRCTEDWMQFTKLIMFWVLFTLCFGSNLYPLQKAVPYGWELLCKVRE